MLKEHTESLHSVDFHSDKMRSMTLHVMLTRHELETRSLTGLCGATVTGLYLGKIPVDGGARRPHLCPTCRSLALKVAANGHETVCSVGSTHS